jgi:hypothetical protein
MKKHILLILTAQILFVVNAFSQAETYYGNSAGNGNPTPDIENCSFGYQAGDIVTGAYSIFVGAHCGQLNTSGNRNAFLGHTSGRMNSTGSQNVFVGMSSGYSNTTGTNNVFIGHVAGYYNLSGTRNVFVGQSSGTNSTASDNSLFGYYSGKLLTSGGQNTFFGSFAGQNVTTGTGNVFMGYSAGSNETTGSNKLYIDNSSISTPLIYGDFSTDLLKVNGVFNVTGNTGLGIVSPTERLEVAGTARLNAVTQDNTLTRILVSDNTGKIFWRDALNLSGTGDNLGNHTATQSIIPSAANAYDLGSSTNYFRNLYINDKIFSQSSVVLRTTPGDGSANSMSIFLGENSGASNTGMGNSSLGSGSLLSNTTGFQNVAIGENSMYYNISGSANSAIGAGALYANTTGGANTAVGSALAQNTTGFSNVGIGHGALQYNMTGSGNVGIGSSAGMSSTQTNLTNIVAIGTNAQVNATEGVAIGANSIVNVSQGFVLGTAGSMIGIRNNSPAYALHVLNAYCDGNTWVNASDKNIKENFRAITDENILSKVMNLKIERWCYKTDTLKIDHIGPYAQDFYKEFKLGVNNKSITTVDESGIALAAIQELNLKVQKLEDLINTQRQQIDALLNSNVKSPLDDDTGLRIYQNNPNPFSIDTEIKMDIPDKTINAKLYIYDLEGKTIEEVLISERGNVTTKIEGGKFSSGIYLYTLIADGHSTDVKKMLLTK